MHFCRNGSTPFCAEVISKNRHELGEEVKLLVLMNLCVTYAHNNEEINGAEVVLEYYG
jgi:hypothetical protein